MPAILTHDFFGRGVADAAADLLGFRSVDETDAFLLGNQGPDPLFYLLVDASAHEWHTLGNVMHDARTAPLFLALREAADALEGRERAVARAYVAGFACHWQLDSAAHPLVYHWQYGICAAGVEGLDERHGSRVHAEIERDWDEAVLFAHTGRTVATYAPHERVLLGSREVLAVIDGLYVAAAREVYGLAAPDDVYTRGVQSFRFVQRLFDSPGGGKRAVLGRVERAFTREPYSLLNSMSHRDRAEATSDFDNRDHAEWANPATGQTSTASFWDLFAGAQEAAPGTIRALLLSPGLDLAGARALCADTNFEGAPTAPDDAYTW